MKNILPISIYYVRIGLVVATLFTSCTSYRFPLKSFFVPTSSANVTIPAHQADPAPLGISPTDVITEMIGKVSIDRARTDLRLLSGENAICMDGQCYTISNRFTGSEGLKWAKKYVYNELVKLGYSVAYQDWSRSEYSDQNIVARKPGVLKPEEEIYFVAHLDGAGSSGGRYPAADDNASGVVDLIELARVLSGYSFSRTVVLLISTGEEPGTLGVKSYLSQLTAAELGAIKYAFNIDMVGYDADNDQVMELWHGDKSSSVDLANQVVTVIQTYGIGLQPVLVVGCG